VEKRFDFAIEACKQVISLSSAGLVLTLTFREKFLKDGILPISFISFFVLSLLAIILSLFCILSTAGVIELAMKKSEEPKLYNHTLRALYFGMVITYILALGCLCYGAITTFSHKNNPEAEARTVNFNTLNK
jgi:hypothetical protein